MKIFAETERLILRELIESDKNGMFELDSNPEVHRYLGNNPVTDMDSIVEVIAFVRQQYADNGIGRWAVIDKETGDFMGWCGLKFVTETVNNHQNYHDLGYRFIQKYWGKGFATESAKAALHYGFETLGLKEIYAAADAENAASNKILTRLGFQFKETFIDDDRLNNWYVLSETDWAILQAPEN